MAAAPPAHSRLPALLPALASSGSGRATLALALPRIHVGWFLSDVFVPFVLTRLALAAVGLVATSGDLLGAWAGWDAGWYLNIARFGYIQHTGEQSNTAFAPALPLLMHLAGLLMGAADSDVVLLISGVIISNAALLVGLGYLVALVRLDFDAPTARRAALYLLVFPTTLFLSTVYPHALFLAASIAAFYYARKGRWWLAGLLGGLAGLARVQGAIIVLPLAFEYLVSPGFNIRKIRLNALAPLLGASGGIVFLLYMWVAVGDPFASVHAQAFWVRHLTAPWEPLLDYLNQPFGAHGTDRSPLDLAFTLLLIALVALSWRRVRPSTALFASLLVLIALSSGQLVSIMRFGLELFPAFVVLAMSGRYRLFHYTYLASAGYLALRFMFEFAQGVWIA
jgi:Mannosyltransferase (PIG-V)